MKINNKGKRNYGSLMIEKAQLTSKIKLLFILYRISFLMHGMIINTVSFIVTIFKYWTFIVDFVLHVNNIIKILKNNSTFRFVY